MGTCHTGSHKTWCSSFLPQTDMFTTENRQPGGSRRENCRIPSIWGSQLGVCVCVWVVLKKNEKENPEKNPPVSGGPRKLHTTSRLAQRLGGATSSPWQGRRADPGILSKCNSQKVIWVSSEGLSQLISPRAHKSVHLSTIGHGPGTAWIYAPRQLSWNKPSKQRSRGSVPRPFARPKGGKGCPELETSVLNASKSGKPKGRCASFSDFDPLGWPLPYTDPIACQNLQAAQRWVTSPSRPSKRM